MKLNRTLLILLLILVLQAVLWRPFLFWPLEQDEGVYAYIGQSILRGELPYKDVFDHKPPLIYYIYSSVFKIFGNSLVPLRLVTLTCSLATNATIFFITSMLLGPPGGLIASLFYAVFSGNPHIQGTSANTETFMVLPLLLAWLCYILGQRREGRGGRWFYLLAGVFSGAAIMLKQVAALNLLALFGFILFYDAPARRWKLATLISGSLLFPLIFSFYFLYRSAFAEYLNFGFLYNFIYLQMAHLCTWQNTLDLLGSNLVLIVLALIGACLIVLSGKEKGPIMILVWTGVSLLAAVMRRYFYGHYFIQVLPGLVMLAAYPLVASGSWARKRRYLAILLTLALFFVSGYYSFWLLKRSPRKVARAKYHLTSFIELPGLGAEIKKLTLEEDRIFIWGTASPLYFYADRRAASRFIYINPLFLGGAYGKRAEEDLLQDIHRNRPELIIWQKSGPGFKPSFRAIEANYEFLKELDGFRIYTRRKGRDQ